MTSQCKEVINTHLGQT